MYAVVNAAMVLATTVERTAKGESGAYLTRTEDYQAMQSEHKKIDEFLQSKKFWQDMNMQSFAKFKKLWSGAQVCEQFGDCKSLRSMAGSVSRQARLVNAHHQSRKAILGIQ